MKEYYESLQKFNKKEKNRIINKIPKDFNNLPIETIKHLEIVSKIHQLLKKKITKKGFTDSDIEVLSCFCNFLNR